MSFWDAPNLVGAEGVDAIPPPMHRIRQRFAPSALSAQSTNVRLAQQLDQSTSLQSITPGMRIAVAVGSRGIDQLITVITILVAKLKAVGAEPFIVPAMGSHGGATSEGQRRILESYGVVPDRLGAPVVSSMDVEEIGKLADDTPIYCDRAAYECDGVVLVNRVKPHTSFTGAVESGLTKMMVIGLGKHAGAAALHRAGFEAIEQRMLEAAPIFLAQAPILLGVALVEDSCHQLSEVETVEPHSWLLREKTLLERARAKMPKIPLDDIDVLVIGEMGKDISGAGIDPNVINRAGSPAFRPSPTPRVSKLAILDLTEESAGNAIGVGVADVTTRKLADRIDWHHTYANAITATTLAGARLPLVARTDREAIGIALRTANRLDDLRLVYMTNTLELEHIWVSQACLAQLDPSTTDIVTPCELSFTEIGDLAITESQRRPP